MREQNITNKMLKLIRGEKEKEKVRKYTAKPLNEETVVDDDNFLTRAKTLMEEAVNQKKKLNEGSADGSGDGFVIKSGDLQFGNFRNSQEESIRKTIGDVELKDDALVYYPDIDDIVLNGFVKGINIKFQFRYNDQSGDGVYITGADIQLTDANTKTVEKIRAAFQNWKTEIMEDDTILKDLDKAAKSGKQ